MSKALTGPLPSTDMSSLVNSLARRIWDTSWDVNLVME
jgi:hypothetical protein